MSKTDVQQNQQQDDQPEGEDGGDDGTYNDSLLPIANVGRIMKNCAPADVKIGIDSKKAMQILLAEFIGFVVSEAHEQCLNEKRKTLCGDDLLKALAKLGFEDYAEILQPYLNRYKENEQTGTKKKRRIEQPEA